MSREVKLPTVDDGQLIQPPLAELSLSQAHYVCKCLAFGLVVSDWLSRNPPQSSPCAPTAESNGMSEFIRVDRQHCNARKLPSLVLSGHLLELLWSLWAAETLFTKCCLTTTMAQLLPLFCPDYAVGINKNVSRVAKKYGNDIPFIGPVLASLFSLFHLWFE